MLISRFQLAEFQLTFILNKRKPAIMEEALKSLPKRLDEAYKGIMDRINMKGKDVEALRILSWIFYAFRPLSASELGEALAIREGVKLNKDLIQNLTDILDTCENLLVYNDSSQTVEFTHYSAKEYLAREQIQKLLRPEQVAKLCLNYTLYGDFKDGPVATGDSLSDRFDNFPFSRYAGRYWGDHLRAVTDQSLIKEDAIELLRSDAKRNAMLQIYIHETLHEFYTAKDFQGLTALHVIAIEGLDRTCQRVLEAQASLPTKIWYTHSEL